MITNVETRRFIGTGIVLKAVVALFAFSAFSMNAYGAPSAQNDVYDVDEDSVLIVPAVDGVLANDDADGGPVLVVNLVDVRPDVAVAAVGTETLDGVPLDMEADGSFVYDPRGFFDSLAVGEDQVDTAVSGRTTTQYTTTPASDVPDVTITINGVNDAPTDITLSANTLSENAGANFGIGNFTTTDVDTTDTHVYDLVGGTGSTDNALFTISGGELQAINSLDREFKASYSIRVRTQDFGDVAKTLNGGSFAKVFTINVTDQNDNAPVYTNLSTISVDENTTAVVTLTTTDADTIGNNPPAFAIGGGTDQGDFSLSGDELSFSPTPDFESPADSNTDNVYVVDIRAFDGANQSFQTITVTVDNVSDVDPTGTANSKTINEDASYSFASADFGFADLNGDTFQSVTITTLPSSGFIKDNGTNVTVSGTQIAAGDIATLTYEPAAHESGSGIGDFTFTVLDSSGADDATARTFEIDVTAVADTPGLAVAAASGDEDTAISLDVNGSLVDADGSETLSYEITGVPAGASLSAGSEAAGVWTITEAQRSGLTITPPLHDDSEFNLSTTAIATESGSGDTANSVASVVAVTVTSVSDVPNLSVPATISGNEDTGIALPITTSLVDADGSETLTVILTSVPTGVVPSNSTDLGSGTWRVDTIAGLTLTPVANSDADFSVNVIATAEDTDGGPASTAPQAVSVTVVAVADTPSVAVTGAVATNEDTAVTLTINGSLGVDVDGSETLSYRVSDVPDGATLSVGKNAGSGVWNLTVAQAASVSLTPKLHDDSDFSLSVQAVTTEGANADEALSVAAPIAVTVTAVVDTPNFTTNNASGSEDVALTLPITASLVDTDGSETLTLQVTGVPTGATLNNGTNAGGGVWNLVEADLSGLTILNNPNDDSDFTINVTATSTDNDSSSITLGPNAINVTIAAVADVPAVVVTNSVTKDEDDNPIPLTIAGDLTDTDGSETLTYQISGVLASATLSAGTDTGGGVWTLTEAEAETSLSITMDTHVALDFQIDVRALATEARDGSTQSSVPGSARININITDKADAATIVVTSPASGIEDNPIPLRIDGDLVDLDGSETLTMFITGHPSDSTFSAGTDLGDDKWGVDGDDLSGLTISVATNNNDDFTLTITATATELANGDKSEATDTIDVQIQPVNDAPSLAPASFTIDEHASNGSAVGTVTAIDIEPVGSELAQSFTYEIVGSVFTINNDGEITVADAAQADFETTPQFNLEVTARDSGLPSLTATATITINLNNLNDNPPVAVTDNINVDELETVNFNVLTNDTDPDLLLDTLEVAEVEGDIGLVGVPVDVEVDGVVVGTVTLNADGSGAFVATPDNTVEIFEASFEYRVSDGISTSVNVGTVSITLNPINDNQPQLSADGVSLVASGVTFDEDRYPSQGTPFTVVVNNLFTDLDIDPDGILDSNTLEDNDSLVFSIADNTDPLVLQFNLDSGDLSLWSDQHVHGSSTITIRATDTAAPVDQISSVDLDLPVTINSINDAPIYQFGSYSNYDIDEDSGDIAIDLAGSFSDADLADDTPLDDVTTYRLTIVDTANDFVLTPMIDPDGLNVISDDTPLDSSRTLVVETTDPNITLDVFDDAHGVVEITVRATDEGRPPEEPADAIPLFDEAFLRVTVNGIGDDQPVAEDDHYGTNLDLTVNEDGDPLFFDALLNDYQGDVPAKVVIVGQSITDSSGAEQALISSTRLADTNDTGDLIIEVNGEVSCAFVDCLDAQRGVISIDGDGIADAEIAYQPRPDFNGEDSFTYCIEDSASAGDLEACATITINVLPVNDPPVLDESVVFTMDQADDLVVSAEDGLRNFVRDIDNTHIDGLGCDPLLDSCNPGIGDPQPDRLYYYFDGAITAEGGQLFPPFLDDGSFNYRPSVTFIGEDSFGFQVCDTATPGDVDHCAAGIVSIQIEPLEGAPEGSSDNTVQFDYQLAQTPLELPIGPEPNVLVVNDDSGSMSWDIMSEGSSGLYQLATGNSLYYVNKATAGSSTYIAPAETDAPNQGIWRLRNSTFNTVYYNPEVRYEPWDGLDTGDNEFPDSPPTAARHNPLSSATTTNLTTTIDFTGRALSAGERVCTRTCRFFFFGRCVSFRTTCTGGGTFSRIQSNGFYIPRYYKWTDLNGNGILDAEPSPAREADLCAPPNPRVLGCSEGELIEIRDSGDSYPRAKARTDCRTTGTSCTYDEEIQNFANWFTYYRSREFTAKAALGVVVSKAQNLRLGYGKLNSESNILPIESMNTSERAGAKAAMLDAIYATNSIGGTPLRRSLRDAGRYFECVANDIFDSSGETSAGNAACPILPAPDGNCQQNFTLLITDGVWNGSSPSTGNSDGDNNSNFDGGAFAGSDFTTLADVAMLYYERDLHPDLNNEVPTTSRDRALAAEDAFENDLDEIMHQHMTTYTVGFGVKGVVDGEPDNFATGFNWGNPFSSNLRKIDDVRHAAYNGRGEYLDASNAANLADELVEAFKEFSQGSGAASAVSFNSQEIQEDTLIFRAFYNTKINTGDLLAQRLTADGLDEIPVWNSAEALDAQPANSREIITYDAVNAQGIPFRPANLNTAQKDSFISNSGASEAQKNAEVTQRVNYLRGDPANERPVGNFRERPAVKGRLGDIVHSTPVFVGNPNRPDRDGGEYPSADRYADFKADNFERREVIYVAANDGMLHGFSAEDGSEIFGFIPNNLMLNPFSRRLTELLNFEYEHKFFVDLTPAINDVYIDADEDGDKDWATILVGGQGAGAKAYFALDVTDPGQLTEATATNVVLWEFTDEDDTYPTDSGGNPLLTSGGLQRQDLQDTPQPVKDLGYSFSVPTIAMSNVKDSDGENEWVAMFGNGYNSTSGIAKLYVLLTDKGTDGTWCHPDMIHNVTLNGPLPAECVGKQDFVKIDTGFGVDASTGFPNGLGAPRGIDIDRNGTLDYAYAGDTFGNFFRFDLTSSNFSDWSVTKIFEAKYEDGVGTVTAQPIITRPIVTEVLGVDGLIVIFATGSYITIPDGRNKDIQSIYGLFERFSPALINIDDMVQQRYLNVTDDTFGNVRVLTANEVDFTPSGGAKGWYNHLDTVAEGGSQVLDDPEFPGEKAIRNIQLRGGLAFVNSIIPRSDTSCVEVAGGFALSFCPATGGTNCLDDGAIFDLDNDGNFDSVESDGTPAAVAGIRFEDAVPTDSSFIEDKRVTQLSDKSLDIIGTDTDNNRQTGPLSWKELDAVEFD